MKRNVGGMGEDLVSMWANEVGIFANSSQDRDAAGWDYILEWPVETPTLPCQVRIPLDKSPCPLKCLLQVKSTDMTKRHVSIKLSNWVHLVRHPLPAFFLILEFGHQRTCQKAYLVHVGQEHIARVHAKLRNLHVSAPKCDLAKKTMLLKWGDENLLPSLHGEALEGAIKGHVIPDMDQYVLHKQQLCQTIGYENGACEMQITIGMPRNVDPEEHLIDFDLGIVAQLELSGGVLYDKRFGIKVPRTNLDRGSRLEITSRKPLGVGEMEIIDVDTGKSVKINGQVFVPSAFSGHVSKDKLRARFVHPFMDFSIHLAGCRRQFSSSIRISDPDESAKIRALYDVAKLILLIHEAAERSHSLRFSVGFNDFRRTGELIARKSTSPLVIEYARLVRSAWIVARHFELDENLEVSIRELARHKGPLQALSGILDPLPVNFKVTGWLSEAESLHGKEFCVPVVAMAKLGQHVIGVAAGLIGTAQRIAEGQDGAIQFEIVTHDVRIVREHAGDDAAIAAAKAEEMKASVVKAYEHLEIIDMDL